MPVLVSKVCRLRAKVRLSVCRTLVCCLIATCFFICESGMVSAQSSVLESVPVNNGQSVLRPQDASPASKVPTFRAAANGVARINDNDSTFTSRVQRDDSPSVPRSLLVPQGPTEDDYTPEEQQGLQSNDLRGENVPTASFSRPQYTQSSSQSSSQYSLGDQGNSQSPPPMNGQIGNGQSMNAPSENPFAQSLRSSGIQNPAQRSFEAPSVASPAQFESAQGSPSGGLGGTTQSFGDSTSQSNLSSGNVRSRISDPFSGSNSQPAAQSRINDPFSGPSSQPAGAPVSSQAFSTQPSPSVRFSEPTVPMNRLTPQAGFSNPQRTINSAATSPNRAVQGSYNSPINSQGSSAQSLVRPTGFNEPAKPVDTKLAKSMMEKFVINPNGQNLPGTPLKLIEILREMTIVDQRPRMISQYWETYYDWASLVNAQEYSMWLGRLNAGPSPAQQALLEAARSEARNTTLASQIQLGKSQSLLMQYLPNRPAEFLPLPSDKPLLGKYRTEYEKFKYFQMMPVNLRGIDQILPKQLQLIADRAKTVNVAKSAANQMAQALSNRQTTLQSVLEAARDWRISEKKLVGSVVSYNQAIADYALTVAQGYQSPQAVAAMLIAKPKTSTTQPGNQSNQRQASANLNGVFNQRASNLSSQGQAPVNQQRTQFQQQAQAQAQIPAKPANPFGQNQPLANGARRFGSGGGRRGGQADRTANRAGGGNPNVSFGRNSQGGIPGRQPTFNGNNNGAAAALRAAPGRGVGNPIPNNTIPNNAIPNNAIPTGGKSNITNPGNAAPIDAAPPAVNGAFAPQKGVYNPLPPIRSGGGGAGAGQFGPTPTQSPATRSAQGFGGAFR